MESIPASRLDLPEISPGQIMVRAARQAARPRALVVCTLALVVCWLGWMAIVSVFRPPEAEATPLDVYAERPWDRRELPASGLAGTEALFRRAVPVQALQLAGLARLASVDARLREWTGLLVCFLWALVVWSLPGGLVARWAALGLVRGERPGWSATVGFVGRRWLSYLGAVLLPVTGMVLLAAPGALVGLLGRSGFGLALLAVAWPLYLLGGAALALLAIGLALGWPLLWAAISVEGGDGFDAVSRAYNYVFDSLLRFAGYVLLAGLLGLAGWAAVCVFAAAVLHFAVWAASWGAGVEPLRPALGGAVDADTLGGRGLAFWSAAVQLVAAAYLPSFVFTAGTALYLLLRFQVDGAELDQVHSDEPPGEKLPPFEQLAEP
jgi:hypothetical protein